MLMKKSKLTRLIAVFLSLMTLGSSFAVTSAANEAAEEGSSTVGYDIAEIQALLSAEEYVKYAQRNANVARAKKSIEIDAVNYNKEATDAAVAVVDGGLFTPNSGTVAWDVEIPETAKYTIEIVYTFPDKDGKIGEPGDAFYIKLPDNASEGKSTAIERRLRVDGEYPFKGARYLSISKVWRDDFVVDEEGNKSLKNDLAGNDIRPNKSITPEWCEYTLCDSTGYDVHPYEIVFEKGTHTISLEATREDMVIKSITLDAYEDLPTYEEYLKIHGDADATGAEVFKVQAELADATSDQTIYPSNDRTSAITEPQSPSLSKLNYLGGTKWQSVGQWIRYTFECEKTGYYDIVPRYKQGDLAGMYTSRRVLINGEVPFEEANYLQFNYSDSWQTKPLNNGETEFKFYFEEGKTYTIEFEVVLGNMSDIIGRVQSALTSINSDYLKILQITGADPDEYRDYNFNGLIPDTIRDMYQQYLVLDEVSKLITEITGEKGSNTATLDNIARVLKKMASDEDEVAKNLDTLKSYIGTLGTWLNNVRNQPLSFDYIQIQPSGSKLPKAEAGFFKAIGFEISSFVMSFFTDYSNLGATIELAEEDVIDVWVQTGRDQAQVVRAMCDNYFTSTNNIGVNLRLVTGGTLLPATLSGMGPDIAMEQAQGTPVQYAIRNAVQPLNHFDTFDEVTSRFSDAAIEPLTLYGSTYGLPETQSFQMMFYRKDIFADLGIDIPKTWDDLMAAVPVLQYNNMQVGIPQNYGGLQLFLYQMGEDMYDGKEYDVDGSDYREWYGSKINLDSNVALEAFDTLCSYFTQYSFPITYDAANRFRTGEMPVIFADYVSMYNQLSIFATEIRDLWEFVPVIGMEDEDGNINNTAISTVTSMIMMNGCDKQENAWRFMDWYTSEQTQKDYANEMIAIVGMGAMYATANKEAIESLPWSTTDLENILAQYNNLAIIPEMPGGYIIARYVGFAFLDAYNNQADPVEGLLDYIDDINKEITRKRQEFDLPTLELGQTIEEAIEAQKQNETAN